MGTIYEKKDKFRHSLLSESHALLDLRLLELCEMRFAWKGKHTLSFNRGFLVQKGGGRMVNHTDGKEYELRPGIAYFIPPGIELSYDFFPKTIFTGLHFQLFILPCIDVFSGETHCRTLPIGTEFPAAAGEMLAKPTDWAVFCRFEALIWNLLATLEEPDTARLNQLAGLYGKYGRALAYIRDNINADMGVEEVAEVAEAKRDTFSRHFSGDFGIPLKTFIMNELIATSERYLLHSGLPVREIAAELKFSSEFYFSTFFRRLKGVSPARFRAIRRTSDQSNSIPLIEGA